MRTKEKLRERIELAIVEEINVTNIITQGEPEIYIPRFVQTLANKLLEITFDEIHSRR